MSETHPPAPTPARDLATLEAIVARQDAELRELRRENETLRHYIRTLRREQYGPRSEQLPQGQQIFEFYGRVQEKHPGPPAEEPPTSSRRRPTGRTVIPLELRREKVLHDVPEDEKNCS